MPAPTERELRESLSGTRPYKKRLTSAVASTGKCIPESGTRVVAGVRRKMPYVPSDAYAALTTSNGKYKVQRCTLARHKVNVPEAGGCRLYSSDPSWAQGPQYHDGQRPTKDYCAKVRRLKNRAAGTEEPVDTCWTRVDGRRQRGQKVRVHGATVCRHYRWKPPAPPGRSVTPSHSTSSAQRNVEVDVDTPTALALLQDMDLDHLASSPAAPVVSEFRRELGGNGLSASAQAAVNRVVNRAARMETPPSSVEAAVTMARSALRSPPEAGQRSGSARSALESVANNLTMIDPRLADNILGALADGSRAGNAESALVPLVNVAMRAASEERSPSPTTSVERLGGSPGSEVLGLLAKCWPDLGLTGPAVVHKSRSTSVAKSDTSMITASISEAAARRLGAAAADRHDVMLKVGLGTGKEFQPYNLPFKHEVAAYGAVNKLLDRHVSPHFFRNLHSWQCTVRDSKAVPKALEHLARIEARHNPSAVERSGYVFRFLALELGRGTVLQDDRGHAVVSKLSDAGKASVSFQVLWSLAALESAGIQHNDLHGGNIFLDSSPGSVTATYVLDARHVFVVPIPAGAFVRLFDFDWSQTYGLSDRAVKPTNSNITANSCNNYNICLPRNKYVDAFFVAHTLRTFRLLSPAAHATLVPKEFAAAHTGRGRSTNGRLCGDPTSGKCGPFNPGPSSGVLLPGAALRALTTSGSNRNDADPFARFLTPFDDVRDWSNVYVHPSAASNSALMARLRSKGAKL